jgi:LysR family transcriptional regulator, glycine cleavage system transcriptional activator
MNYFRRALPSLDALVFFEAAARFQNYTHAARELDVSQVAISKRIRALEADVGTALFQRKGRSVVLTDEGRAFAERVRAGLAFLEEAITVIRSGAPRPRQVIQIAANENMNFFWLAPLVRDFQMTGNDAVVSVVTANNVTDVVRAETDLAIFYGKAPPRGWTAHALFDEIIAPLVSPAYRAGVESGAIKEMTVLDYRKEAPEWVNWDALAQPDAGKWFPKPVIRQCSSYIQSISLALEGKGIGLGVLPMLSREIRDGKLVTLANQPTATGHRYFLGTPDGKKSAAATQDLIATLMSAAHAWKNWAD